MHRIVANQIRNSVDGTLTSGCNFNGPGLPNLSDIVMKEYIVLNSMTAYGIS